MSREHHTVQARRFGVSWKFPTSVHYQIEMITMMSKLEQWNTYRDDRLLFKTIEDIAEI